MRPVNEFHSSVLLWIHCPPLYALFYLITTNVVIQMKNPKRHHPRHTQKKSVKGSLELGNGETQSKALCGCKQSERVALLKFLNAIHVLPLLPAVGFICCGRHLSWPQTLLGGKHDCLNVWPVLHSKNVLVKS